MPRACLGCPTSGCTSSLRRPTRDAAVASEEPLPSGIDSRISS